MADFMGMMNEQGSGLFDIMGILNLLRQLYDQSQSQQMQSRPRSQGLAGAADSGAQQGSGGGATQLPRLPAGTGVPTYGMPAGWTMDQGVPRGWTPGPGGSMFDPAGNGYDAAGHPTTFAGVTNPQLSMPTDRTDLIRSLAHSTQADRYGNTPYIGSSASGYATVTSIPDFSKPPLPGNMIDPRNWDPTQWVNHGEWYNPQVEQARLTYNTLQGQGSHTPNAQHMAANDWRSFGFANKQTWKQAGRPIGQGGIGGGSAPMMGGGSGAMGIGLPSVGSAPAWQTGGYATKFDWKQAGRPTGTP